MQLIIDALITLVGLDLLLCVNPRWRTLNKAFFGAFLSSAEAANIPKLLEQAKEDLNNCEREFNANLDEMSGEAQLLMDEVNELQKRHDQLEKTVKFYIEKGDDANAGSFANQLSAVEEELTAKHDALATADKAYKALLASREQNVKKAQELIKTLESKVKTNKTRDKSSELAERGNAMSSSMSKSAQNLARLSAMINTQDAMSKGRAKRLADDGARANVGTEIPAEVVQSDALARFKATHGLDKPKQLNAPVENPVTAPFEVVKEPVVRQA